MKEIEKKIETLTIAKNNKVTGSLTENLNTARVFQIASMITVLVMGTILCALVCCNAKKFSKRKEVRSEDSARGTTN